VAIAGLGSMGLVCARAVAQSEHLTLVAVADSSSDAHRHLRQSIGEQAAPVMFHSGDELVAGDMLDAHEVDLVAVMTPPDSHERLATAALDAGRHVLCEKPMARDAHESSRMCVAAQRQPGLVALIDHQLRFNPARRWIQQRLASGALGTPLHVQASMRFPRLWASPWTWWSSHLQGGGLLAEYGSHLTDLLQWWFGPADAATGSLRTVVTSRVDSSGQHRVVDSDDLTSFQIVWQDGLTAEVMLSGVSALDRRELVLDTTEATVVLDATDTISVFPRSGGEPVVYDLGERAPSLIGDPRDSYTQPHARLLHAIGTSLRTGEAPPHACTFEMGHRTIVLLDQVRNLSAEATT